MKCIIFTGGIIENLDFIDINELHKSFVICADSGYLYACKLGIEADVIVGDYDSLGFLPEQAKEKFIFPVEKDDTDLMLAIKEALKRGYDQIDIYGALGGRFDHTFGNIQALGYIAENNARGRIITENEEIIMLNPGEYEFEYRQNYSLSLFAYSDKAEGLTLSGVKYIAENICLTNSFPLGMSNYIIDKTAHISFKTGRILAVCSKIINNIFENA